MTRCKLCVMPDTRPDTAFVDGVCSACISYAKRKTIDWASREKQLLDILEQSRRPGAEFDCIVPSSGGKDSTWQVLKLLELGVRPLVVTATTCHLTEIGRKNIANLSRYASTIEVTPNRTIRARLNRLGLQLVGDISWPEHVAIFTTPFKVAAHMGINLMFYGECPQEAYGGPIGTDTAQTLTARWRSEFGGFLGLRPGDLVGREGITERDMMDYMLPPAERLRDVTAYFLGQFYEWDSHRNGEVAKAHGMKTTGFAPSRANWWSAENLDNAQTGLHDHMMFRKYGYGRLCAQISVDVRTGRRTDGWGVITREMAMDIVKRQDGAFPEDYMGISIQTVLERIGMTRTELDEVIEKFSRKDGNA